VAVAVARVSWQRAQAYLSVQAIVPHHMHHNAEPEAVDLLLEVDSIALLNEHVDEANCDRTCRYLTAVATYLPVPDDVAAFAAAYNAYMKIGKVHDAMRVALRMGDRDRIEEVFAACNDKLDKQQLGYLLARQGVMLDCEEKGRCAIDDHELQEQVRNCNLHLSPTGNFSTEPMVPCSVHLGANHNRVAGRYLQPLTIAAMHAV
jgi:RPN1 N-terminal domain